MAVKTCTECNNPVVSRHRYGDLSTTVCADCALPDDVEVEDDALVEDDYGGSETYTLEQ